MKKSVLVRLAVAGVLAIVIVSGYWTMKWHSGAMPTSREDAAAGHAAILPLLPSIENGAELCDPVIGSFRPEAPLSLSHQEGATALTPAGHLVVSGFSHFIKNKLIGNARIERLDADSLTWHVQETPSPTVASHIQGAATDTTFWIAGGFIGQHPGPAINHVWRLDLSTGEWFPGPKLPEARASGGLVAVDQKLHYVGGLKRDRQTDADEHYALDLADPREWTVLGRFERPRNHFQAVSIGSVIFAPGGQTGHDDGVEDLTYLDAYHASLKTWVPLSDLPESRSHAEMGTFVYENRILLVGGRTDEKIEHGVGSILSYNPYTNRWSRIGELPVPLYVPFAAVLADRLYVGGGGTNWHSPQTRAWSAPITMECD